LQAGFIEIQELPFEPYAPVRRQMFNIIRVVNRARLKAGFEPVPIEYLRLRRHMLNLRELDQAYERLLQEMV
jgi:hypothetical protein